MTLDYEHLKATLTDRGFTHMPPLTPYSGADELRVYESSNAEEPCVWLLIDGHAVQLPVGIAWQLADQLRDLVVGHYQRNSFQGESWLEDDEAKRVRERMKAIAGQRQKESGV